MRRKREREIEREREREREKERKRVQRGYGVVYVCEISNSTMRMIKKEWSLGNTSLELPTMFLCFEIYVSPQGTIVGVCSRHLPQFFDL